MKGKPGEPYLEPFLGPWAVRDELIQLAAGRQTYVAYGTERYRVRDPVRHPCRVYWGSHGCDLERGHAGGHVCACCDCPEGRHDGVTAPTLVDDDDVLCVSRAPYYGTGTNFWGEDAP